MDKNGNVTSSFLFHPNKNAEPAMKQVRTEFILDKLPIGRVTPL